MKETLPQYSCTTHALERAQQSIAQRCLQQIRHNMNLSMQMIDHMMSYYFKAAIEFHVALSTWLQIIMNGCFHKCFEQLHERWQSV
jgi:hypothetical protein